MSSDKTYHHAKKVMCVVGGVYTSVSAKFNRGSLVGLSRCLKSTTNDAGIMIEYE